MKNNYETPRTEETRLFFESAMMTGSDWGVQDAPGEIPDVLDEFIF